MMIELVFGKHHILPELRMATRKFQNGHGVRVIELDGLTPDTSLFSVEHIRSGNVVVSNDIMQQHELRQAMREIAAA